MNKEEMKENDKVARVVDFCIKRFLEEVGMKKDIAIFVRGGMYALILSDPASALEFLLKIQGGISEIVRELERWKDNSTP